MLVINSANRGSVSRLRELWEHRELLYFLTWREIMIRHKQTVVGIAWVVLQPLVAMLVLGVALSKVFRVEDTGAPYALFCLAGLAPWNFFAAGLGHASNSLVVNPDLVTKIYFPRMAVPLSILLAGLVDLGINLVCIGAALAWYQWIPPLAVVWLPLFILMDFVAVLGISLWLSALNVEYRDVRYVIPFVIQIWMFATPVFYPASLIHEPTRMFYALNPMAGVVEGFRWAILGMDAFPAQMIATSAGSAALLLVTGFYYFHRAEASFADIV